MFVTGAVEICVALYFSGANFADAVRTSQGNTKQQSLSHRAKEKLDFQDRAGDSDHFVPLPSQPAFGSLPSGYHPRWPLSHSSSSSRLSHASNASDPYPPSTTLRTAASFERDPLGLLVPWTKGTIDEKHHPYLVEADESGRGSREQPDLLEPLLGLVLPWEGGTNLQRAWREKLLSKTPTEESKLEKTSNADSSNDFDDWEDHDEHISIVERIKMLRDRTATPQDSINSLAIAALEVTRDFEMDMEKRKSLLSEAVRRLLEEVSEHVNRDPLNSTSWKARKHDADTEALRQEALRRALEVYLGLSDKHK